MPQDTLVFRQLFDARSSTYTYLLGDPTSGEAVLIDPVFEQVRRDAALITELGLALRATLDTHVHADHVTGAWLLQQKLGSQIALSARSGASGAGQYLESGDRIPFGGRYVEVRATPGHTDGCVTYVLDDHSMAFTGDCLLIRGCGRTDFQQGDAHTMYQSVWKQIFSLSDECVLWPGHDYQGRTRTTVGEEKRHNPRLGEGRREDDFVIYMKNLGLPHPRKIDIALPANLHCGQPNDVTRAPDEPSWAPLTYTFAGIWVVEPTWLEEHLDEVQLVDVREPAELDGVLGSIAGARRIPLGELGARSAELERDRPIVTVCRSGTRSAQAAVLLAKAGFPDVANLAGGMLRWREREFPVEGCNEATG